jgi:hypothetical protein
MRIVPFAGWQIPKAYLHLVHLIFDALHFTNDGASFGILHPTIDAMVQTFVFTVFCETDAWLKIKTKKKQSRKISLQLNWIIVFISK